MILRLLKNRNFIFMSAILTGLIFPQAAAYSKPLMLWALAFVMMLATLNVPNNFFRSPRAILLPSAAGILMTYLISGGTLVGLSALMIDQAAFRTGFILIAAVPPAVAVIPFSGILDGDVPYALAGTVAAYLAALLIMPLIFLIFFGANLADPYELVRIMVILIVLPLILSRFILRANLQTRIAPIKGLLTDWSFFIVLYTIIGVNSSLIFENPLAVAPSVFVAFAATFILGFLIERLARAFNMDRQKTMSLVLLGTLKNQGIAGGLALSVFPQETALPAAAYTVFMFLFFMWLDVRRRLRAPLRRLAGAD